MIERSCPQLGGHLLVQCLTKLGAQHAFGVPGESYLSVLDGFYRERNSIEFITCRHEGGAAFMAAAYGRLTQRPGLCFVTRGPGACNASIGVHAAMQDGVPMLLFIGQVARDDLNRFAFQEVDLVAMFRPLAKWAVQIDNPERIPELIQRAWDCASTGRPGPVVLALPEDMLTQTTQAQPLTATEFYTTKQYDAAALQPLLEAAQAPLVLLGGTCWHAQGLAALHQWIREWDLPVAVQWRRQDLYDANSVHYIGDVGLGINPKLAQTLREVDLLILMGSELDENTTQGFQFPAVSQGMSHQQNQALKILRISCFQEQSAFAYTPHYALTAELNAFAMQLRSSCLPAQSFATKPWAQWVQQARENYMQWSSPPQTPRHNMDLAHAIHILQQQLSNDAILCNGAGNFAAWLHRYYRYRLCGTQLASQSGAMGFGLPAAVCAKIIHPERQVVVIAGDGDFMMNRQELATALQYGAYIIVIVVNNGSYGTIRMHQERHYPDRVSATGLTNPDFIALANAYGAYGLSAQSHHEFSTALTLAIEKSKQQSIIIELKCDIEYISPATTITTLRKSL